VSFFAEKAIFFYTPYTVQGMVCTLLTFIEYPATRRRAPGPYHRLPAGLRSAVASRPSGRRLPAVCTLFTPPRARLLPAPALHGADDAVAVGRRPDEVSAGELHLVRGKVRR